MTLLVGCQKGHPAYKNLSDEVLTWLSSGAKCKRVAYGSADATATPSSLLQEIQNDLSFWYWPTQVVLEKRPLNDCVCVCVCVCLCLLDTAVSPAKTAEPIPVPFWMVTVGDRGTIVLRGDPTPGEGAILEAMCSHACITVVACYYIVLLKCVLSMVVIIYLWCRCLISYTTRRHQ